MGTWVCLQGTATTWLGLDQGLAGRSSPALPQDAWRWIEITSQEQSLSCGPLGTRVASDHLVTSLPEQSPLSCLQSWASRVFTMVYLGASGWQWKLSGLSSPEHPTSLPQADE